MIHLLHTWQTAFLPCLPFVSLFYSSTLLLTTYFFVLYSFCISFPRFMIMSIVNYYLCKKLLCTYNVLKSIQSDFKNKWVPFDLFSKDAKSKVLFLIFCSKLTKLLLMNRKVKNIIIIFSIKLYCHEFFYSRLRKCL